MLSICLTNFNREKILYESIEQVIDMPEVSEVIISDDCSDYELYKRVVDHYKPWPKVKVSRTDTNIDCYRNKRRSVSLATNDWVILLDSDNVVTNEYIEAITNCRISNNKNVIFQPSYAKPHFDFTNYNHCLIDRRVLSDQINQPQFQTMLNAFNFFVNRDEFLRIWDIGYEEGLKIWRNFDPVTSDSIFFNYHWLKEGNSIYVVPGLEYFHRVDDHKGEEKSHYAKNNRRTKKGFHESIVNKLKAMK